MKKIILSLFTLATATFAQAQFNVVTPTTYNSNTGIIDMLPGGTCGTPVNGAAWDPVTLDFTKNFTIDWEAKLTAYHGVGADGHMVIFGSNINTAPGGTIGGGAGGMLGYFNTPGTAFNNSVGVEFDIFDNGALTSDPWQDHIMVRRNANLGSVIAAAVTTDPGGASTQTGTYRNYRLEWDCENQQLHIYYMGNYRTTASFNPAAEFTNPAAVKWGFTASKDWFCSHHILRRVVVGQSDLCGTCMHAQNLVSFVGCGGGGYQMIFTPTANPLPDIEVSAFIVDYGDGTSTTLLPPFGALAHTYFTPGPKTVTVVAVGYDRITGDCCREKITTRLVIPNCAAGGSAGKGAGNTTTVEDNVISDYAKSFHVYPNPTSGIINIVTDNTTFNKLVISDITGKVLFEQQYKGASDAVVDMGKFANGSYVVNIYTDKGEMLTERVTLTERK